MKFCPMSEIVSLASRGMVSPAKMLVLNVNNIEFFIDNASCRKM